MTTIFEDALQAAIEKRKRPAVTVTVTNQASPGTAEVMARLLLDMESLALRVVDGTIVHDEQDSHLPSEQQRPL